MGIFKPKLNKNIQDKINNLNAKVMISVPHINGLSLSENTLCQIYYCDDRIVIDSDCKTFNIPIDEVKSINLKTDVEIHEQYVSSAGGAVAGAMVFGPLGALIGGKAKKKTFTDIKKYLIITHNDKFYGFDVTHTPKANNIVEFFKNTY